jgi:hypothetical protein
VGSCISRCAGFPEVLELLHTAWQRNLAGHVPGEVQDVIVADQLEQLEARLEFGGKRPRLEDQVVLGRRPDRDGLPPAHDALLDDLLVAEETNAKDLRTRVFHRDGLHLHRHGAGLRSMPRSLRLRH